MSVAALHTECSATTHCVQRLCTTNMSGGAFIAVTLFTTSFLPAKTEWHYQQVTKIFLQQKDFPIFLSVAERFLCF